MNSTLISSFALRGNARGPLNPETDFNNEAMANKESAGK